jgi:hypothetical protein
MVSGLTDRLRPALELMRVPLAVTAISNAQAGYLLWCGTTEREWRIGAALALAAMSLGLYCFGMVSNDIVDVRRDRYLAPNRPLVAGRIGMNEAWWLAGGLLGLGLTGGVVFAVGFGGGWASLLLVAWTVLLIFFYNLMGKFVGAVGILTLGLIRFFHAAAAQPSMGVLWHPLLLMDHVVVLSVVCYILERKRPHLGRAHRWTVGLILLGLNALLIGGVATAIWWRDGLGDLPRRMGLGEELLWPGIAVTVFAAFVFATVLALRQEEGLSNRGLVERQRRTGRKLMFFGLLWLIVYDVAFVYGFLKL